MSYLLDRLFKHAKYDEDKVLVFKTEQGWNIQARNNLDCAKVTLTVYNLAAFTKYGFLTEQENGDNQGKVSMVLKSEEEEVDITSDNMSAGQIKVGLSGKVKLVLTLKDFKQCEVFNLLNLVIQLLAQEVF